MKLFTQLALVSAIAVSGNAMAMQALDDAQLASTTGQDGITLVIKPPVKPFAALTAGAGGVINIDSIYVHDNDGAVGAVTTATQGAITLDGFAIAGNAPIVVKIDADGNGAANTTNAAFLNVNIALPSELIIRTGTIGVAKSNRDATSAASVRGIVTGTKAAILDSIDVKLGGATMNIQLGNEVQAGNVNATTMIKVNGTITDGLSITGLKLKDSAGLAAAAGVDGNGDGDFLDAGDTPPQIGTTGGEISIGEILVRDTGGANLTLATDIDVSANGLILTMGGSKTDIMLADVVLGNKAAVAGVNADTTKSIGDVEIVGLDMIGAQIAVRGH